MEGWNKPLNPILCYRVRAAHVGGWNGVVLSSIKFYVGPLWSYVPESAHLGKE